MARIHIVGAGLTGLSAALHLKRAGVETTVWEKQKTAGGHAVTVEEDGYRFDRTGHLLHLKDPVTRKLVVTLVGDKLLSISRKSRVFSHGRYTRYPYQANTFGLPADVAYACLSGFFDALETRAQRPAPTNFREFCEREFGSGFTEHFMIPYNRKLWGVEPEEISAAWCQRFVPRPNRDDVLAGAAGLQDRELGYNAHFLYPQSGIGALSEALAQEVSSALSLRTSVTKVDWQSRKVNVQRSDGSRDWLDYDKLIWSGPLDTLVAALKAPPREVREAGKRLRCNSLTYLDLALRVPCPLDLHWVYVPEERYPFYRVGCYSNFSASMAPADGACLYVELASREVTCADEVMPHVLPGLVEMKFIQNARDIAFARLRRIQHAYVVFDHHHADALGAIEPFLERYGIRSCGRYGAWNYSSMGDALIFGRDAAKWANPRAFHTDRD